MGKKMRTLQYNSKQEFAEDIQLIFDNCYTYNSAENSPFRKHALLLKEKADLLLRGVPDITVHMTDDFDSIASDAQMGGDALCRGMGYSPSVLDSPMDGTRALPRPVISSSGELADAIAAGSATPSPEASMKVGSYERRSSVGMGRYQTHWRAAFRPSTRLSRSQWVPFFPEIAYFHDTIPQDRYFVAPTIPPLPRHFPRTSLSVLVQNVNALRRIHSVRRRLVRPPLPPEELVPLPTIEGVGEQVYAAPATQNEHQSRKWVSMVAALVLQSAGFDGIQRSALRLLVDVILLYFGRFLGMVRQKLPSSGTHAALREAMARQGALTVERLGYFMRDQFLARPQRLAGIQRALESRLDRMERRESNLLHGGAEEDEPLDHSGEEDPSFPENGADDLDVFGLRESGLLTSQPSMTDLPKTGGRRGKRSSRQAEAARVDTRGRGHVASGGSHRPVPGSRSGRRQACSPPRAVVNFLFISCSALGAARNLSRMGGEKGMLLAGKGSHQAAI